MNKKSDFDISKHFEKIRQALLDLGYENKKISIEEAIKLYQIYGDGFSEETFAKEVFCITAERYKKMKATNGYIVILKIKDILTEEEVDKLKLKMIHDGYSMNKVNLESFLNLYDNYGDGLTERTFAIEVLGLSYGNYRRLKEVEDAFVVVLKNSGDIESTIKRMKEDGYSDYLINNYDDFLKLYEKYGTNFTEVFFSEKVLNITYDEYRRLRRKNFELRILATPFLDSDLEVLINILNSKGYSEKKIDYDEFLQLYKEYGTNLSEKDFATRVLNLTLDSYKAIKFKNSKSAILSKVSFNKDVDKIRQQLVDKKMINKPIDYEELLQLYEQYGDNLLEKDFALYVLDLSLDSYRALRSCNNMDRFRILKNEIPREVERIKQILIEKGYREKIISYLEFKDLYLEYGHFISERQFAMQILELSSPSFQNIKYDSKLSATILPFKKLTKNEIQDIKQELIDLGYEDIKISMEELDELYSKYSHMMSKSTFFEKVLEIYRVDTNSKQLVTILRRKDILKEDDIEKIKNKIREEGYYFKWCRPEFVNKLYDAYGAGLTYNTFIQQILGITRKQIIGAKQDGLVRIVDIKIKNTMEFILNKYLMDIRYYSKEEILDLCNKYNVDLESFIFYSLVKTTRNKHNVYIETYTNILNTHGKLWIGNDRVSNEIISLYYDQIKDQIMKIIYCVKLLYPKVFNNSQELDDEFQNLFLFFMENGSEIEKNFMVYNDPTWTRYFYGKLRRRLLFNVFARIENSKKFDKPTFIGKSGEIRKIEMKDEKFNTEEIVLNKIEVDADTLGDQSILLLGNLLLKGMTISEAKKIICDKFNISELQLAGFMKIYVEKNNVSNFDFSILNISEDEPETPKKIEFNKKNK